MEEKTSKDNTSVNDVSTVSNTTRGVSIYNLHISIFWKYVLAVILVIIILMLLMLNTNSKFNIFNKYASEQDAKQDTNINVALKWLHQSQFAGNYVAQKKGFYDIHGLNASLIPYDFTNSPIDMVVSGRAEFGIASASELVLARSNGAPIKAIAVIYQINPVCAFTFKSSNITSPKDFIGKKIGIDKAINIEYDYMMENLNINRSELTEIAIGWNAEELLDGTVDISMGYVTNPPYFGKFKESDFNVIMTADYGVDMYADVLFTTDKLISTNPELVYNFVQATLDGWYYTLEHEDEALNIVMQYSEIQDIAHEDYELKTSLHLINTGDGAIGLMGAKGWFNVQKILSLQNPAIGLVNISEYYTTQFVDLREVWHDI